MRLLKLANVALRMQRRVPTFISFNVTNRCVQRCPMCNVWRAPSEELSVDEITGIFTQLREAARIKPPSKKVLRKRVRAPKKLISKTAERPVAAMRPISLPVAKVAAKSAPATGRVFEKKVMEEKLVAAD